MRQRSIFPLSGSTGNFTFYSTRHGNFVRLKSKKIDKKRMASDPRFEALRKNSSEFKTVMNSAKMVTNSLRPLIEKAKNGNAHSRLTSLLFKIIKTDKVNERGLRRVFNSDVEMLKGFEFNEKLKLENVLRSRYTVSFNRADGDADVIVQPFVPNQYLCPSSGATHYRFVMGAAGIDFENQDEKSGQATSELFAINADLADSVHLQVKLPAKSRGIALILVGIEFYEQTGNMFTPLPQAALKIVHASKP